MWKNGRRKEERDEESSLDHGPQKPGRSTDLPTDVDMGKVQSFQNMIKERTEQLCLPEDAMVQKLSAETGRKGLKKMEKILTGPEYFI